MKLALRLGGFAIGAVGTVAFIAFYDSIFPWYWLPILMGCVISAVVAIQPWFVNTRLSGPFCLAITLGTSLTYSLSATPITARIATTIPQYARIGELVLFILSILLFVTRGLFQRKTAKMTAWLLIPIAAGCTLGYVSGGIGGGDHMVAWAMANLHMSRETAEEIVHYLRKTIHFTAYGFVGLSFFHGALAGGAQKARSALFALLCVLCLASFDELRQTTAPNRTGSVWDVALDMSGATTFTLIASAIVRKPRTPSRASAAKPR